MRYRGYSVTEASDALGINIQTGYNWQTAWNDRGVDSLIPKVSTGRPSSMTDDQKRLLMEQVSKKNMTTNDVRRFISERMKIDYSEKQVHVILKKMGFRHAKPYPKDYRQPADAENILKKTSQMCWIR